MLMGGASFRLRILGLLKPHNAKDADGRFDRPINWIHRDDWVMLSVKMGLNAREISEFSYSWPQPISTVQQVFQMIERLNLRRAYNRARKVRGGHHHKMIAFVFMKLFGQAMEHGHEVTNIQRDQVPVEGMKFRPDLGGEIDGKLFYVEAQLSRIIHTRWGTKFRNYVKLYKKLKRPITVLFLIDRVGDIATLRRYARDVLENEGVRFSIFRFLTIDQFRQERDILRINVWFTERRGQPVSLL